MGKSQKHPELPQKPRKPHQSYLHLVKYELFDRFRIYDTMNTGGTLHNSSIMCTLKARTFFPAVFFCWNDNLRSPWISKKLRLSIFNRPSLLTLIGRICSIRCRSSKTKPRSTCQKVTSCLAGPKRRRPRSKKCRSS